MSAPTSLHEYFHSIDAAKLAEFKEHRRQEDLHLDFKLVGRRGSGDEVTTEDRKSLAEALSGFANADGGVIVWGVDCRKVDGVDAVTELRPLQNAARALSDLKSITHVAVNPAVQGVEHRVIETSDGRGFVITLVPASDSGPHMAKFSDDRYYRRSADSFRRMEHFEIADMFGRRAQPALTMFAKLDANGSKLERRFRATLFIRNSGRALALFPTLQVTVDRDVGWEHFSSLSLPPIGTSTSDARTRTCGGGPEHVVHVGSDRQVLSFTFSYNSTPMVLRYVASAQGCPPNAATYTIGDEEVQRAIESQ